MASYKSIEKQLKIQQEIEGNTPETALLWKVLPLCKHGSDWQSMVDVAEHRYGKLSYECHTFYYPSDLLLGLQTLFGPVEWQGAGFEEQQEKE